MKPPARRAWAAYEVIRRMRGFITHARDSRPIIGRRQTRPSVELGRMWPFSRQRKSPELRAEPDTSRHELLKSQLANTLRYGWHGSGRSNAKEFFESLPPADDRSQFVERLGSRRPD